ncbi:glycosyltransferase involved in cell wall bisynthesis [Alloalcanivorax xenomutans]|uniref:glycosyltransferase family 4 protein n=1 Tax=Alloalcanivorax xenomutans TaxID=1094342 RepID=UPI000BD25927|nr:glycosyltransferase family 4 protein [Alloalcanivorax xenomutans]SOC02089.1 glycosyltransferase involved in cell wall bisynthesis [Alloalcanivorax xenomutans]
MVSKVKKVLHVGCSYLPYLGGGTHRLLEISRRLCQNFEVNLSIITHTRSDSYNKKDIQEKDEVFSSIYRQININSLSGAKQFLETVRLESPDVVILHNSRVAAIYFILVLPFLRRKVINVVEIHSIRENGRLQKIINRWLYGKADFVVVLAEASRRFIIKEYNVPERKVGVVKNGYERKEISRSTRYYNPGSITYAYVGSFHEWQGVVDLCLAVTSIERDFWKKNSIYFIGNGPCFSKCKEMVEAYSESTLNIYFTGWLSAAETEHLMAKTDFLMAPRPSTIATETVVPLKVSDSIAFGIPLICSTVGGLLELLENRDCAIFYDKDNIGELVRVMKEPPSEEDYKKMVSNLINERDNIGTWEESARCYWGVLYD